MLSGAEAFQFVEDMHADGRRQIAVWISRFVDFREKRCNRHVPLARYRDRLGPEFVFERK